VDYDDPTQPGRLTPGAKLHDTPRNEIDRALTEIYDRNNSKMQNSTSVQVLSNPSFAAEAVYATLNAVLQTAISSLQPYKELSERSIGSLFEQMLLWVDYTDDKLFGTETKAKADNYGVHYAIRKEDFDPDNIYIDVEINASSPTDKMMKINAGAMMYQLGFDKETIFEELGVEDPERVILNRYMEDMLSNEVGAKMELRRMEIAQQNQPPAPNVPNTGAPDFDAAGNMQGMNPAMGGMPPAMANPDATREMMSGFDKLGRST